MFRIVTKLSLEIPIFSQKYLSNNFSKRLITVICALSFTFTIFLKADSSNGLSPCSVTRKPLLYDTNLDEITR